MRHYCKRRTGEKRCGMKVIIPINGKNERIGRLFKTPKHLLLYRGIPAIKYNLEFFNCIPGIDRVYILTNLHYIAELYDFSDLAKIINVGETPSQVATLREFTTSLSDEAVMFIDCDIILNELTVPDRNTVFVFENKNKDKQYSNYKVDEEREIVLGCNEKQEYEKYAGAGVYYFKSAQVFNKYSVGCSSISEVISKMIAQGETFFVNINSDIFRFGTLKDILS